MNYHYMVVEGPHDAAAVGKVLELLGARSLTKLRTLKKFDERGYFHKLTDLDFPYKDNLTERMPVPLFFRFAREGIAPELVAIHAAGGESAIMETMSVTLDGMDDKGATLSSLSIIGDADEWSPVETLDYHKEKLDQIADRPMIMNHFKDVESAGTVLDRGTRIGVFVLPDNLNRGTLEDLLLECADTSYQDIRVKADQYVKHFDDSYGVEWSVSKRNKVIVGCINNVLRPGTSNTVSIAKDSWLCTETMTLNSASKLQLFLKQLLGIEACSEEKVSEEQESSQAQE